MNFQYNEMKQPTLKNACFGAGVSCFFTHIIPPCEGIQINKREETPDMPDASNGTVPTWRDFPDFYANPFVKQLAANEKWTVSDKDKRPIDMRALIDKKKIWGIAFDRGYNPMVDLATLCETIPSATNNAYFLDALIDKFVVMDIEPDCPEHLRNQFLSLPYIYGEVSMSGRGYHLVFDLPEDIIEKYPIAKQKTQLKHPTGYYEILLNHMVTFTRNSLPPSDNKQGPAAFRNVFELLAMEAKATNKAKCTPIDDSISLDEIPYAQPILSVLRGSKYKKTLNDFVNKKSGHVDHSAFEFGTAGFYFAILQRALPKRTYKDHKYSDEECARLIYEILQEVLPYRPKHDEARYGMPWLCFIAADIVAKNSKPKESKPEKKKGEN